MKKKSQEEEHKQKVYFAIVLTVGVEVSECIVWGLQEVIIKGGCLYHLPSFPAICNADMIQISKAILEARGNVTVNSRRDREPECLMKLGNG